MKVLLEFTGQEFAEANDDIIALVNGLNGGGVTKAKTKPKTKKAEPEEDEDEEIEEDEDDEDESDETAEVDADMIKEAIQSAIKGGKKESVAKLFAEYKAKTVSGLKETQYEKFYTELKSLTKKK